MSLERYQNLLKPHVRNSRHGASYIRFWEPSVKGWIPFSPDMSVESALVHIIGIDRGFIEEAGELEDVFEVKLQPMFMVTESSMGTRFTSSLTAIHICSELRSAELWGVVILDRQQAYTSVEIGGALARIATREDKWREPTAPPYPDQGMAFFSETDAVLAAAYMAANNVIFHSWKD